MPNNILEVIIMKLLTLKNAKTEKSVELGFLTAILHLSPADSSGYEVCFGRSEGCTKACNNTSGRGRFTETQLARIKKTRRLFEDRPAFIKQLYKDIEATERKADRENLIPAIRLNGTSDLPWFHKQYGEVIQNFPHIQFYDYTKVIGYIKPDSKAMELDNYHLVFSRSENNLDKCLKAIQYGVNIAVPFELDENKQLPSHYMGLPVVNGDDHDLIFLHDSPCIIGLRYKVGYDFDTGKMIKRDCSGFTVIYDQELGQWVDPQTARPRHQSLAVLQ